MPPVTESSLDTRQAESIARTDRTRIRDDQAFFGLDEVILTRDREMPRRPDLWSADR